MKDEGMRVCSKCGKPKPLLTDFYRNRGGYRRECKLCHTSSRRRCGPTRSTPRFSINYRDMNGVAVRVCVKCREPKPLLTDFYRDRGERRRAQCVACISKIRREQRAWSLPNCTHTQTKWVAANRGKVREYQLKYQQTQRAAASPQYMAKLLRREIGGQLLKWPEWLLRQKQEQILLIRTIRSTKRAIKQSDSSKDNTQEAG